MLKHFYGSAVVIELQFMTAGAFTVEYTNFDYLETNKRFCKASSHLQEKYLVS